MKTPTFYIIRGIRTGIWLILIICTIFSTIQVNDYFLKKRHIATNNGKDQTGNKPLPYFTLPVVKPEPVIEPDLEIEKWMMNESYWTGKPKTVTNEKKLSIISNGFKKKDTTDTPEKSKTASSAFHSNQLKRDSQTVRPTE